MELDAYLSDKQKKRKKRRRYLYVFLALLVVYMVLVGTAWIAFRSPWLRIKNITVEGNNTVSSDSVTTLLQSSVLRDHNFLKSLLGINNMLIWPSTLATSDLAFIPQLASVTLAKDYLSRTITIEVTERAPFGIWCFVSGIAGPLAPAAVASDTTALENENCYWFDSQGVLFARTFDTQGSQMFSVHDYSQSGRGLGNKILPDEFVPNLVSIVNVIRTSGIQVDDVALKDIGLQEIDVTTYDGPTLYFSLRFPADEDLAVLQNLMAKPGFNTLQYIDFTVENRAYYK
ncbi:MAG: hypothetical protein ABSE18_00065 [Minisyncoccia bacterium]|jgi:hypothetical protein